MSENAYCPYCGSIMKKGDVFCNNCGASLDSSSQSPQTQTTPQQPQTYQQPNIYSQPVQQVTNVQLGGQPVAPPMNRDADNALVWGIVGLFCTCGAIPAVIFGIRGLSNPYNKSKAIVGLVLGALVLIAALIAILLNFFLWY